MSAPVNAGAATQSRYRKISAIAAITAAPPSATTWAVSVLITRRLRATRRLGVSTLAEWLIAAVAYSASFASSRSTRRADSGT